MCFLIYIIMMSHKGNAGISALLVNSNLNPHCSVSVRSMSNGILIISLLFLLLTSCSGFVQVGIDSDLEDKCVVQLAGLPAGAHLDVFVYDDITGRMDSYQRFSSWNGGPVDVSSRSGPRRVVLCTGRDDFSWMDVRSWNSLETRMVRLEDEQLHRPFMSGVLYLTAGQEGDAVLSPLCSEIVLRSIRCSFHNTAYSGECLRNVRVYLTNVSAESSVLGLSSACPSRHVNVGRLSEEDVHGFASPSMIFQEVEGDVGAQVRNLDLEFRCYPNTSLEDGPGTPFTRLVIEGTVGDDVWYWPLDINRGSMAADGARPGIERGVRYVLDVEITRKGSSDPDVPVDIHRAGVELKIEGWKEKEGYSVSF